MTAGLPTPLTPPRCLKWKGVSGIAHGWRKLAQDCPGQQQTVRSARQGYEAEVLVELRCRGVLGIHHEGGHGKHPAGLDNLVAGVGQENRIEPLTMECLIDRQSTE